MAIAECRPALGLFNDAAFTTAQCPMGENDLVMRYSLTDSGTEVEGPDQQLYSQEMLVNAVRKRTEAAGFGVVRRIAGGDQGICPR